MQRFNKLKLKLIERKDDLERAICASTAKDQYAETVALVAKYEEVNEILKDMCNMKMEGIFETKERTRLRVVR